MNLQLLPKTKPDGWIREIAGTLESPIKQYLIWPNLSRNLDTSEVSDRIDDFRESGQTLSNSSVSGLMKAISQFWDFFIEFENTNKCLINFKVEFFTFSNQSLRKNSLQHVSDQIWLKTSESLRSLNQRDDFRKTGHRWDCYCKSSCFNRLR